MALKMFLWFILTITKALCFLLLVALLTPIAYFAWRYTTSPTFCRQGSM